MRDDSNGYEGMAREYMARGNPHVGVGAVMEWSGRLSAGAAVLDLGCGPGFGVSESLVRAGFRVHGVDASRTMAEMFRERLPGVPVLVGDVLTVELFERRFDAAVAWGLMFLLRAEEQERLMARVSEALVDGGRFLFTAPWQVCTWRDLMTHLESRSLGRDRYVELLGVNGFELEGELQDIGENHYWLTRKDGSSRRPTFAG